MTKHITSCYRKHEDLRANWLHLMFIKRKINIRVVYINRPRKG